MTAPTLLAMPVVQQSAIQPANGDFQQAWSQYLASLDAFIRALLSAGALTPLPAPAVPAVNPIGGAPTLLWARYWLNRDLLIRGSSWTIPPGGGGGSRPANKVLTPLPPMTGFAMAFMETGVLLSPWAQYMSSVDALARPQ